MRRIRSPDCTLTGVMFLTDRVRRIYLPAAVAALTGLILVGAHVVPAQQANNTTETLTFSGPTAEPNAIALPLAEDRGEAALEQSLKRLRSEEHTSELQSLRH